MFVLDSLLTNYLIELGSVRQKPALNPIIALIPKPGIITIIMLMLSF